MVSFKMFMLGPPPHVCTHTQPQHDMAHTVSPWSLALDEIDARYLRYLRLDLFAFAELVAPGVGDVRVAGAVAPLLGDLLRRGLALELLLVLGLFRVRARKRVRVRVKARARIG